MFQRKIFDGLLEHPVDNSGLFQESPCSNVHANCNVFDVLKTNKYTYITYILSWQVYVQA